jgi:glycosyltransferase involved in cell wall biosynthesis
MSDSIKNITVLMPVYNDSQYLQNSIKNILNQTHKDFEFLIIDDGSEDNTEEVIKRFKDSRINYRKIKHTGLAGSLNYGLSIAGGDWIARIDADDLNTPGRLKRQIDFLKNNPHCDVVSSWSVYFRDYSKILFIQRTPLEDRDIKSFLDLHNPINHSSVIFNKRKIINRGSYNIEFKCYEDFELWFRLKDELRFGIIPEVLVYTRLRENSLSKTGSKKAIHDLLIKNAAQKINCSNSGMEKSYWENIAFWAEYFYGTKEDVRKHFSGKVTLKKTLAVVNTFLPESIFERVLDYRLRQRLQSEFSEKRKFKAELLELLK